MERERRQQPAEGSGEGTIAERIDSAILHLPSGAVTLAEIRSLIGREGLLVLAAFLTLVFLVPVSVPGVSTVFGAGILLIGVCRFLGKELWVPALLTKREIPSEKLAGALRKGMVFFRRLERLSRPGRVACFASGRVVAFVNDGGLVLGAVLLMMPFGLVPFSNTLPALAVLFLAVGLLQKDGLCILLGHLLNLATIVYFGLLISAGAVVFTGVMRFIGRGS